MGNQSQVSPPAVTIKEKTRVDRVHSYLGIVSTTIGICGAVGTGFVWLAANFYTGDVIIRPDKQVNMLAVKVFDARGQQATYYTNQIQLMPGRYHLEVSPDNGLSQHCDAVVKFRETTLLPVAVIAGAKADGQPSTDSLAGKTKPRRWWQFWRGKDDGSRL